MCLGLFRYSMIDFNTSAAPAYSWLPNFTYMGSSLYQYDIVWRSTRQFYMSSGHQFSKLYTINVVV